MRKRTKKRTSSILMKLSTLSLIIAFALLTFGSTVARADVIYDPPTFHGAAFENSSQVVVVTSPSMNSTDATLTAYQKSGNSWNAVLSASALIGQNGMQYDNARVQNTNTTPSGVYGIPFAFGWASNPGTRLAYRVADSNSYWDENSGSPTYNRWVEGNPGGENEQLAAQPLYKYALALDFNWNQTPGKGAGIFIHIKPHYYTGGCVGIAESELVQLMQWLDPSANPKVLICPQSDFGQYYYSDTVPISISNIDTPTEGSTLADSVTVQGWELARTGVSRVDFYLDNNQWLGSTSNLYARDDVQAAMNRNGYYPNPSKCGFTFSFNTHALDSGLHTIHIAEIANDGSVQWDTRQFYSIGGALTTIDTPHGTVSGENISIDGWMLNRSGQDRVDFYLDNYRWLGSTNSFSQRPDVQQIINGQNLYSPNGVNSGYSYSISAASIGSGTHTLHVAGIGSDGSVKWADATFTVANSMMNLDSPYGTVSSNVQVSGWALNHAGVQRVDAYLDLGTSNQKFFSTNGTSNARLPRADVHNIVDPGYLYENSQNSGFSLTIPATLGTHTISVAAIGNDGEVQWRQSTFTVSNPVGQMSLDSPTDGSAFTGDIPVGGWALSYAGIQRVDTYLDLGTGSQKFYSTNGTGNAQLPREDVHNIIDPNSQYANSKNSGFYLAIPAADVTSGTHIVRVAAISNDGIVQWRTCRFTKN